MVVYFQYFVYIHITLTYKFFNSAQFQIYRFFYLVTEIWVFCYFGCWYISNIYDGRVLLLLETIEVTN